MEWRVLRESNTELPCDPAIPLPGLCITKELKAETQTDICTLVSIVV